MIIGYGETTHCARIVPASATATGDTPLEDLYEQSMVVNRKKATGSAFRYGSG